MQSTEDHTCMHKSESIQTSKAAATPHLPPGMASYRDRLLRLAEVRFMTGLGKSSIYAAIQAGTFPAAVNVTDYAVAWRESEVDAWIAARPVAAAEVPKRPMPAGEAASARKYAPIKSRASSGSAAPSRVAPSKKVAA